MNKEQEIAGEIQLIKHSLQGIKDRLDKIDKISTSYKKTYSIGNIFSRFNDVYMIVCCGEEKVTIVDHHTGVKIGENPPVKVKCVYEITEREFREIMPRSFYEGLEKIA